MIKKEKGQMPLPTNREHMTPTRCKKVSVATKSRQKKEKGRIPFPTDTALNGAGKVNTGLYRDKKTINVKRKKKKKRKEKR